MCFNSFGILYLTLNNSKFTLGLIFSSNEKAIALKATIAFSDILKAVSKEVHFSYMEKIAQNL